MSERSSLHREPPRQAHRLAVAIVLGIVCGLVTFWRTSHSLDEPGGDFWQHWAAARALLAGIDPYAALNPSTLRVAGDASTALGHWYFYPLPSVLIGLPFVWLSPSAGAGAFIGLATVAFAYVITRQGLGPLAICLSAPFVFCLFSGQSTPAIVAAALVPAAQGLLALKPNVGMAMFAARPSRWAWVGGVLLVVVSLIVLPTWPREWLAAVARSPFHHAPIAWWVGAPLLLLAGIKWRRPEARLFVVFACIPQVPLFYDQLPLALVPSTDRERLVFAWCSWAADLGWVYSSSHGQMRTADMRDAPPWILALVYTPALFMLLRRTNTGQVPVWVERLAAHAPLWLRGTSTTLRAEDPVAREIQPLDYGLSQGR